MIRNMLALTGLAALLLVAAAAVYASGWWQRDGRYPQMAVSFAGLDLSTREGLALLDGRVKRAVDKVCGPIDYANAAQAARVRQCRRWAFAGAEPQIAAAVAQAVERRELAAERAAQLAAEADAREALAQAAPPVPPEALPAAQPRVVFAPYQEIVQPLPVKRESVKRRYTHRRKVWRGRD